ncbi:MAG: hypothetical protein K2Q29_11850 [Sphingomonadales bacterium]|nr:hypothetical protein [Sphingomonadales bacterium]
MLHPRQAFPDAERLMAIGRAFRERAQPAFTDSPNVIRFPVERLRKPLR